MQLLIKWRGNWADEINLNGFMIYDSDAWQTLSNDIAAYEKSFSVCVGTNEDIEYDNGKCLLQNMSVTELTDDEANVLAKLFSSCYGNIQVFETISYLLYNADSDEYEEDEDDG
jgi:hypothetical protein